jgi:hypothetical protein
MVTAKEVRWLLMRLNSELLVDIACMHCGLSVIYLVWPEHHPFSELPNHRFTYITGVEFLYGGRER